MKVSLNWLKEYVDVSLEPQKLADALTMSGIAVDAVIYVGNEVNNIYVGEVKDVARHPNADKLSLCQVDVNDTMRDLSIVCGAPNVKQGQKVVVALPGATLPQSITIKKTTIRGVESYGMICSAQELGIDDQLVPEEDREGILVLEDDVEIGSDAKKLLGLDDIILVLDLTPNRSDCLSMIHVAREVAALEGKTIRLPEIKLAHHQPVELRVAVDIDEENLCHRYVARVIKNITIKPSPTWMQKRLQAAGVRPINNVVDITNYVMLEMGQPLHAFDYDQIAEQRIVVRRAKDHETIQTLDGKERKLHSEMLLITDPSGPIAIAGVMGGYDTEVTDVTENLVIESAYFDPISVRKTSKELGLRSEASLRFEKGIDKDQVRMAADRACQLLEKYAGGLAAEAYVDNYPIKYTPSRIILRKKRVNDTIGIYLSIKDIQRLLDKIKLPSEVQDEEMLVVTVPSYRGDIAEEVDLIEEVARLYGYDNIPTTLPMGTIARQEKTNTHTIEGLARRSMTACGLMEVITYSFLNEKAYDRLLIHPEDGLRNFVTVANPLSEDGGVMRTTLIPNLIDVYRKNFSKRVETVNIFEIGRVYYHRDHSLPLEINKLGILVSGELWNGWQWPKQEVDFYYLKGIAERLAKESKLSFTYSPYANISYLHPGRTALLHVNEEVIGSIGELHPEVRDLYEIEKPMFLMEIDLDKLAKNCPLNITYQEIPRYPSVQRDLAIVMDEQIPVGQVMQVIREHAGNLLTDVALFDVYRGKQIPEGMKSLAISLHYQSMEKTLTDIEVNESYESITSHLFKKFGAKLR